MDDEDGRAAAALSPPPAAAAYVSWEEDVISNEKGGRLVHYRLRDAGGAAALAVVGRERSVRHMSYYVPARFLRSLPVAPPLVPAAAVTEDGVPLKWKTRREVIDWVSSFVTDSVSYGYSPMMDRFSDEEDAEPTKIPIFKGISSGKLGQLPKEFSWLGSSWNCRKRRKHYRSFCRNRVTISVHDFVYVMADDDKRLVAYVEDLYEDLRANNMVVVRWFHKADEVGLVLPPDVSDREIFFSLCLQDFSVECIDGLAAVLSPQDFEKFRSEARQSPWEPYLCCRQIDNDDIKPFDIAQLQGYWSQELLRYLYTASTKIQLKIKCSGSSINGNGDSCVPAIEPKKKNLLDNGDIDVMETDRAIRKSKGFGHGSQAGRHVKKSTMSPRLLRKDLLKQKLQHQQLALGSQVEVLSQDSGIRGCWFRCTILKRRYDKVKVRYLDVQNAEETDNLEEWILASRVAAPDKLGVRLSGRPIVRPLPSHSGVGIFNVGTVVDAWWNDGWWEGIVILKESEGKFRVYFPGEERLSVIDQGDLRHSQDWVGNKWSAIKDRGDVASSLLPALDCRSRDISRDGFILLRARNSIRHADSNPRSKCSPAGANSKAPPEIRSENADDKEVLNLKKLVGSSWSSRKKRQFGKDTLSKSDSDSKRQCKGSNSSGSSKDEVEQSNASGVFVVPKSLTVEQEICKIGGDHLFSAPMALCSGLLMSR